MRPRGNLGDKGAEGAGKCESGLVEHEEVNICDSVESAEEALNVKCLIYY